MNEATQNGLAMAAIGVVGTIAGLFFGWLKDRDKLLHAEDTTALKAQNTIQAGQISALETRLGAITATQQECEKKHKECEDKQQTAELRLKDVEAAVARLNTIKG